jgi:UDP-N-acetylmuramoylalanine--D-glutamate ligase
METMIATTRTAMSETTVQGKAVSVIGAARSGVAVARLLARHGATVFVSDAGPEATLGEQLSMLRALGAQVETGGHTERILEADLVVVSPGVPSTIPILREAERREIRVVGELELASWFCPAPIIGVTGTNGKTTTTTLIGRMLHDGKRKHAVGGNIGNAFSTMLEDLDAHSIAVLEVSSFQLDHIESFRPAVAILLNITPDHLDRYDHKFEKYIAAKCRIFENQTLDDTLIYNFDDAETREQVRRFASLHVRTLPFGLERQFEEGAFLEEGKLVTILRGVRSEILPSEEITIRGIHNLYNSMAAVLAAQAFGVGVPSLRATLRNFRGVEHRLEFVRELRGVQYVNDSKATNVDSVWYALQAFREPIVLLLGGRDKGNDYTRLQELVESRVRAIVAIGESAGTVVKAFGTLKPVVMASSMEDAVSRAAGLAQQGDVVLLSPACASFDWFRNYEHRGEVFKQLVLALR